MLESLPFRIKKATRIRENLQVEKMGRRLWQWMLRKCWMPQWHQKRSRRRHGLLRIGRWNSWIRIFWQKNIEKVRWTDIRRLSSYVSLRSTPHPGFQSPLGLWTIFRFGNPNLNLHLPLESWVGGKKIQCIPMTLHTKSHSPKMRFMIFYHFRNVAKQPKRFTVKNARNG